MFSIATMPFVVAGVLYVYRDISNFMWRDSRRLCDQDHKDFADVSDSPSANDGRVLPDAAANPGQSGEEDDHAPNPVATVESVWQSPWRPLVAYGVETVSSKPRTARYSYSANVPLLDRLNGRRGCALLPQGANANLRDQCAARYRNYNGENRCQEKGRRASVFAPRTTIRSPETPRRECAIDCAGRLI